MILPKIIFHNSKMNPYMAPSFAPPMRMGSGGGNNTAIIVGVIIVLIVVGVVYYNSTLETTGCKTPGFDEYSADFDIADNTKCVTPNIGGCMTQGYDAYNPQANVDDGSCGTTCSENYTYTEADGCTEDPKCMDGGSTLFGSYADGGACGEVCSTGYSYDNTEGKCVGDTTSSTTYTPSSEEVLTESLSSGKISNDKKSGASWHTGLDSIEACRQKAIEKNKNAYTFSSDGGCSVFDIQTGFTLLDPDEGKNQQTGCTYYGSLNDLCTENLGDADNTESVQIAASVNINKNVVPGIGSSEGCRIAANDNANANAFSFNTSDNKCEIFDVSEKSSVATESNSNMETGCVDTRYTVAGGCQSVSLPSGMGVDNRYFGGSMKTADHHKALNAHTTYNIHNWGDCQEHAKGVVGANAFVYRTVNWSGTGDAKECRVITMEKPVNEVGEQIQTFDNIILGCIDDEETVGGGCGAATLSDLEASCDTENRKVSGDECGECKDGYEEIDGACVEECGNFSRNNDGSCSTLRCKEGYNMNYNPSNADGEKYRCITSTSDNFIANFNDTETIRLRWRDSVEGDNSDSNPHFKYCDGDHGFVNCVSNGDGKDSEYEIIRKANNSGQNAVDQYEFRNIEQGTEGMWYVKRRQS